MFEKETKKLVNELIQAEYENACKQAGKEFNDEYTDKYHSLYEGYAVLLEEVEEADKEMSFIKDELCRLWTFIKGMRSEGWIKTSVEDLIKNNEQTIEELAQVGAVLMKIKNTLEVVE